MREILMVDLKGQHFRIKEEIDKAIYSVINSSQFINGPSVKEFKASLETYLQVKHVIPCANGTDAIQLALMALNIKKGAEIIVPAFGFAAIAEVVSFLGFIPVFSDVDADTFNISLNNLEKLITERTKVIMPVHLFGQCADMERLLQLAKKYNLYILEDNAQSLGAKYKFKDGSEKFAGTMGDVGITSFFPTKNLGCMGDGGALFTNDDELAERAQMIANHGQKVKYSFEMIGINSRLDSIQAAVLNVKLNYLDTYISGRQKAATVYDRFLAGSELFQIPFRDKNSTHSFNQYTVKISYNNRKELQNFLKSKGIPTMVYYPSPLHLQKAYAYLTYQKGDFPNAEKLCNTVLTLPLHPELDKEQISFICENLLVGLENFKIKNTK